MTAVDELIAFVRAALDEDERVAREASVGPWRASRSEESVYVAESSVVNMPGPMPDWATYVVRPDSEGSEGIEPADAEHIARWDPARVLAEVEAKRRILNGYQQREAESLHSSGKVFGYHATGLLVAIKLLAQPYAGWPGWREEWRA